MAQKRILVTGGNSGIGLALCKQLCKDHDCHVYLGARNVKKGEAAINSIKDLLPNAQVELVQVDTQSTASVNTAAASVKAGLGPHLLYAIVNNAGTGLAHGVDSETMVDTNFYGPKRVCEAFIPLITPTGRIVNVGSGAGPKFVSGVSLDLKKKFTAEVTNIEEIEGLLKEGLVIDPMKGYGVSKACLTMYTMWLAKQYPGLTSSCLSPGFIDTAIVAGFGATKPPEEGTVSIMHCLWDELEGNGWFYGSDALRSPLHFMRNPGEPPYDGKLEL